MPHLRLQVPEEWLDEGFADATGFDARRLLDHLVQVVVGLGMSINLNNLKHAIIPVAHAHVAGDATKRFLHCTLAAGNDTPGRTAEVRVRAARVLGDAIDTFVGDLPGLASVTVHVQDIDRDRGYSTTAERKKKKG
jgi:hypothetical protein